MPIHQTFYKAVEKIQSGDMTIRQAAEYAGMKQTRFYNRYREYLENAKGGKKDEGYNHFNSCKRGD